LRIKDFLYGRLVPCPGKRAFASPKKAGVPLSPGRASAVISPAIPFPPRLFAERKQDGHRKVASGPFCLQRLLFRPGNEKTGQNDQLNWRGSIFKKSNFSKMIFPVI